MHVSGYDSVVDDLGRRTRVTAQVYENCQLVLVAFMSMTSTSMKTSQGSMVAHWVVQALRWWGEEGGVWGCSIDGRVGSGCRNATAERPALATYRDLDAPGFTFTFTFTFTKCIPSITRINANMGWLVVEQVMRWPRLPWSFLTYFSRPLNTT